MHTFSSLGVGRITSGQTDVVIAPRVRRSRRPVVYLHGAGGTGAEAVGVNLPSVLNVCRDIAAAGFVVVAPTITQTWGNATAVARIDAALAWARSAHGAADEDPVLVGGSHGAAVALVYAGGHDVAAVVGMIPGVDVDYIRTNNVLGQKATIEAAWGIASGAPLPAGANPYLGDPGCPVQLWSASNDPVSTNTATYAAARPYVDHHDVGALGHTDTAIAAVDRNAMVAFIVDHT